MSGEREQLKECRLGVTPGGQQQMVVGAQEEEWEGEKAAPCLSQPKDSQLRSTNHHRAAFANTPYINCC